MSHNNSYMQTRSRQLAPAPEPAPAPTPPSSLRNGSQNHPSRHTSQPRAVDRYASMESTTGTNPQAPRLEAYQLPPLQDGISLPSSLLPLPNSNTQPATQPVEYVADSPVDSTLMLSQPDRVDDRDYDRYEAQNNSQVSQEQELWDRLQSVESQNRQLMNNIAYKTHQNMKTTVKHDFRLDRLEQEIRELKRKSQALRFRPYRTSYRSLSQNSMYRSFVDDIGIRPIFRGLSARTIETYALVLPKLEAMTELCLDGRLALDQVSLNATKTIRSLKLVSVGKLDGFTAFMAAFPCLVQFSFESRSTVLLPLDRTAWPKLQFLRLIGVWVNKEAISHVIAIAESHKLTWEFEAVTLANSTRGSLWAAIHQNGHQITFTSNNRAVTYK
ncbi:hypothetical protein FVEG_15982 [Fusarium verticillioides 7600]|uniref:Uncharacterized protein n=1 Tax=Gibberella moniliformis (strain M3125 / FGSC 7600) TaxID=334819 RepID=W7M6D0_GIBM7|nr:hypothetical protein FVEG_15982 [Fusarium verticillioides 7600]EWG46556.1 hypothetical protein FVEG_15982 [Fusarium verticillioides 7600]